jgi:hypothetical protein
LSDDDDYVKDMDVEDEEPDEDDLAFINDDNKDKEKPVLPEEDEEDPEERDLEGDDDSTIAPTDD